MKRGAGLGPAGRVPPKLAALTREIVRCRACPRLVSWREECPATWVLARARDLLASDR